MYIRGESGRVGFFYADEDGLPISGAVLTALVRRDYGSWQSATSSPSEPSPGIAPGFYDLQLTETELTCDHLDWYVKAADSSFAGAGQIEVAENPRTTTQMVFDAIFTEPTDSVDLALEHGFMDRLADHVLRRAMANAERSSHGDAAGAGSLLGVISILTQGQMVATNCQGESFIVLNSAVQGNPPIGVLRVVNNSDGTPIGVLPFSGPNAVPDSSLNCDCPE